MLTDFYERIKINVQKTPGSFRTYKKSKKNRRSSRTFGKNCREYLEVS